MTDTTPDAPSITPSATPSASAPVPAEPTTAQLAIRFSAVLFIIGSISAGLLAVVYSMTKDSIAQNEIRDLEKDLSDAYTAMSSTAVNYEPVDGAVDLWSVIVQSTGARVCFVARGSAYGYSSDIRVLFGVYEATPGDWRIQGIKIQKTEETPGLGENARAEPPVNTWGGMLLGQDDKPAARPPFQAQFKDKPLTMLTGKTAAQITAQKEETGIDAMTGATITSHAAINGAKVAADIIAKHLKLQ